MRTNYDHAEYPDMGRTRGGRGFGRGAMRKQPEASVRLSLNPLADASGSSAIGRGRRSQHSQHDHRKRPNAPARWQSLIIADLTRPRNGSTDLRGGLCQASVGHPRQPIDHRRASRLGTNWGQDGQPRPLRVQCFRSVVPARRTVIAGDSAKNQRKSDSTPTRRR